MGRTRRLVPQVGRWACCAGGAEATHYGVGLPCLLRKFFPDRNAALNPVIVGLGKALVNVPRFSQQTQAYRVVCVIRRVNAT